MTDATELLFAYRESARTLWNNFLRLGAKPYVDFDAVETFSEICERLFKEMVLRPLGESEFNRASEADPYPFLVLKPVADQVPVMVNRPSKEGKYWDEPVEVLTASGSTMQFIDYFDWNQFGYIDLQYYRVRITRCDEYQHLVGREALVDVHHADVEFKPAPTSASCESLGAEDVE